MASVLVRTCFFRKFTVKYFGVSLKHQQKLCKIMGVTSVLQSHFHNTAFLRKKDKRIKVAVDDKNILKKVPVWVNITVDELAKTTARSVDDVREALFYVSRLTYYPDDIIEDTTLLVKTLKNLGLSPIFKANPRFEQKSQNDEKEEKYENLRSPPPDPSVLVKRRPIVTIMGHVDHGKTTLLDTLRNANVVDSEFGGITQHIGAFNVTLKTGETITFLDTPGHAAFSSMRLRGAYVTDIVILVVAADDGVMEQTTESVAMARKANVPIIVAINKIDKPNINIEKTQNLLSGIGLHLEVLGGDVQSVNISALKNTNIDLLMEAVIAQSEIMELKGDPVGKVEGVIIESKTDVGRGKLATVLIKRGTLRKGDYIVSGLAYAKVRAMFDHAGNPIKEATLCDPIQVIGWRELPSVGDEVIQVNNERFANAVVEYRQSKEQEKMSIEQAKVAEEKLHKHLIEYKKQLEMKRSIGRLWLPRKREKEIEVVDDGISKLNVIIKTDVVGSAEAILDTLDTYSEDKKCHLNVVHYGVGQVNETDIRLAEAFDAIIYCFNVPGSKQFKNAQLLKIRHFNVIYKLIDDLKDEITKLLPTTTVEDVIGEADVLKEFEINEKRKKVKVAGCLCVKGELKKLANYKLIRDNETIYTGTLKSMKHLKEEVTSIKKGIECGLMLDNPEISFQEGDKLVCFLNREEQGKLRWNPGF